MYHMAQRARALVEIGRDADGRIPASLISAAYNASRTAPVILVLDSVSAAEVDAVLDPVVAGSFRDHHGVIYADIRDADTLQVPRDARVFAGSEALRRRLASLGLHCQDIAGAEPALLAS